MPSWQVDGTEDVIGLVVVSLIAAVLLFAVAWLIVRLAQRKDIHVSKRGVSVDEHNRRASDNSGAEAMGKPAWHSVTSEHAEVLARLDANVTLLTTNLLEQGIDVRALFTIQRPVLIALKASLEAAKGTINGNVERAIGVIDEAQGKLDDHLMSKIGQVDGD